MPVVSVIVCTYNPRPVLLDWVLTSLDSQTLDPECFEVVVVDNASRTPLDEYRLRARCKAPLRVIREPRQGLTHARCAGILEAQSDLLVFVDDDNYLLPSYLEQAVAIAAGHPEIGHFGGIALPLHEEPITEWQQHFLPSLGIRDNGPEPVTSREKHWGEWEPIGAGMVCRRSIAEKFVDVVRSDRMAQKLGRNGTRLMSGEDTLFARIAVDLGYSCSYQPKLRLFHFIRSARLRRGVLASTLLGHGRAYVILEHLSCRPIQSGGRWPMLVQLARCASYRVMKEGVPAGLIQWCWDLGVFLQTIDMSRKRRGKWLSDSPPVREEPRQNPAP